MKHKHIHELEDHAQRFFLARPDVAQEHILEFLDYVDDCEGTQARQTTDIKEYNKPNNPSDSHLKLVGANK